MNGTDFQMMRAWADEAMERYNRRCRRLVALYMAGRNVTDHIILLRTDERRIAYETAVRDIEKVWTYECERASYGD